MVKSLSEMGSTNLRDMKRFWSGLVLGLNFESFFFDLLASVSLGYKNGCKGQH